MAEPQETVEPQTAPTPELVTEPVAQSEPTETQETPTYLTKEDAMALVEGVLSERESGIRKDLEAAYKTLRRGEAKSDMSIQRIQRLESKLEELATRDMSPEESRIWKLEREVERATTTTAPDATQEISVFQSWSSPFLEEEKIDASDPVLKAAFEKHSNGWQNAADLKVALTRAVAAVHREREKSARTESAEQVKKAREEERAKLRNEKRQEDGKVDKGVAAPTSAQARPKNLMALSKEEWDALKVQKGIRG